MTNTATVFAPIAATTRLLEYAPAVFPARAYKVVIAATTFIEPGSTPRSQVAQFIRCTITTGLVTKQFDVDLISGGCCFDAVFDTIAIDVVNGGTESLFASATVSVRGNGAPWRAPRRTVAVTYPNGVPVLTAVPRYASRVSMSKSTSTNLTLEIRDGADAVIYSLVAPSAAVIPFLDFPLPNSTATFAATATTNMAAFYSFELAV